MTSQRALRALNKASSAITRLRVFGVLQPIWGRATSLLPLDLTASSSTLFVNLELTSRCNLSCVYCPKAFSTEERKRAFDFPVEWIEASMDTLRQRGLWLVSVHGIGESTILKGWHSICQSLYDRGLSLTIVSNFARPLTPEDLDTLMRFRSVLVSIDSPDPKMFARIRRGARLETLLMNVDRLQKEARSRQVPPPELAFDIVVADKTIADLETLVRLGIEHGIRSFYFNDLCKGPDIPGDFNVYNATTLPKPQLAEGFAVLKRAIELAESAGCAVHCQPTLLDGIAACLAPDGRPPNELKILGNASWGAPAVAKGMTRDCSLPWQTAMLYADGHVRPCCTSETSVGDLRTESLDSVLNGAKMKQFRKSLLDGDLEGTTCMHCSMAPEIPVAEFRRRMSGRVVLWSIRRRVLNLLGRKSIELAPESTHTPAQVN
jgi:MoaA/NifB/PqqE/SkfB family radical SAM enzyme